MIETPDTFWDMPLTEREPLRSLKRSDVFLPDILDWATGVVRLALNEDLTRNWI